MGHCLSGAVAFGCGCGVGGLALKGLQSRSAAKEPAPTCIPPEATGSHNAPAMEAEVLQQLLHILWPRIDKFLGVLVQEQIIPEIDRALPSVLKGSVKFPKVQLGRAVPSFRKMCVKERKDHAIVLEVSIDLDSDMDVQIQALRVPLGMKRLKFFGELNVVLQPITSTPPFFGGMTAFFIDPPELDMDFTGAADFVDMPILCDVVRSTILDVVGSVAVLPARIAVDLKEDDDTDQADLSFPDPLGVLRVLLRNGTKLVAADFGMSSDPYVVIEVGQQRWQSSVVEKTLNPVWEHGNVVDILVYEHGQKANVSVFDKDQYTRDDLIGSLPRLPLEPLMTNKPANSDLAITLGGKPAGSLQISSRWFELSSSPPSSIPSAVAMGPSQLVLAVKLLGMSDLPKAFKPPFVVQVDISVVGIRLKSRKSQPPKNIKPVAVEVADIARRLAKVGQPIDKIAEITGLEGRAVNLAIVQDVPSVYAKAKKEAETELSATHPAFDQILRVPVPWTSEVVNKSVVSLTVLDRADRQVAAPVQIRLSQAAVAEAEGGFALGCGGSLQAKLSTLWMKLPA
mmetsp:Transcript_46996/g.105574  ORF Transcript_46996/g.105574 Transcript_46996/m.105574 type:complete len:568 (+) Transcript_46996:38-1741(+)